MAVESDVTDVENNLFYVRSITFSDDTCVELDSDTILVVTGPNNSGKSALLSEVYATIASAEVAYLVSRKIQLNVGFSFETFSSDFLSKLGAQTRIKSGAEFIDLGFVDFPTQHIRGNWPKSFRSLGIGRLFTAYLNTATRLTLADSQGRADYPNLRKFNLNSLQMLDANADLEEGISEIFTSAFNSNLIVNRGPGIKIHLHVGQRDGLPGYERANRREYTDEITKRPALATQGDGMKSFAGILLHTVVDPKSVILLDEPEAFLHPPQIRRLASVLTQNLQTNAQLIVATHSEAFIQGLLDTNLAPRIKIIRISREGDINRVALLEKENLASIWAHQLLRYSELLASLFYDVAILCEGDSDCRFFQAMLDQLAPSLDRLPDFRFFHVGGKDRLHLAISALRAIDVPLTAIVDIDILNDTASFKRIVEALGGNFSDFAADYELAIQPTIQKQPDASSRAIKEKIDFVFTTVELDKPIQKKDSRQLEAAIRIGDRWKAVKLIGRTALGSGETLNAFDRIVSRCLNLGLVINTHGELESLCRTISADNKNEWLSSVLELDLVNDNNLSEARDFVRKIAGVMRSIPAGQKYRPADPVQAAHQAST